MRSRRRIFITVSVLAALSLAGLMSVQLAYLYQAYDRELRIFSQNVDRALGMVTRKLEAREAWVIVSNTLVRSSMTDSTSTMMFRIERDDLLQPQHETVWRTAAGADGDSVMMSISHAGPGTASGVFTLRCETDSMPAPRNMLNIMVVDTGGTSPDTTITSSVVGGELSPADSTAGDSIPFLERRYLIEKVLRDMDDRSGADVAERVDPAWLDSVLAVTLKDAGIETDYAYGITSARGDSLLLAVPERYGGELTDTGFRTSLFPHDIVARGNELVLYFPRQSTYLMRSESGFFAVALFSILLLAACFFYVIRTLWRQKRFSRRIVDFINNMTHEFKTPISTISLVGENLGKMAGDGGREKDYARIIRQESTRMRRQVERILEMAALEEGDLAIEPSRIDLNRLTASAVEGMSVKVAPSGGSVDLKLADGPALVNGDPVHLENVLHNLFDNALKYSPGKAEITVSTARSGGMVRITVEDRGIGIGRDDLRHVFDRYFRVDTGDRHDVKGFGLGLAYVKLIVEAHGGKVRAESRPGEGSVFTIELPALE